MVKIVAGICCNNTKPRTVASLIDLAYTRIICGSVTGGIGLLPYVRNDVVRLAYENEPDFTHLLFIDDDMCDFDADHVQALLDADCPIISGFITSRIAPYRLISKLEQESSEIVMKHLQDQTILEEEHVGMAFTLIKREVLDTVQQPCDVWFTMDRRPRQSFTKETQVFIESLINSDKPEINKLKEAIGWGMTAHLGANLIGEDVEFCHRARAFGYKSYTHCGVVVGHIGSQPYTVRDNLIERSLNANDPNLKLVTS